MKLLNPATTKFCLAFIVAVLTPIANADDWNRKTVVTFSAPIEIPPLHLDGLNVLPAGTYVIRIMDSQSNRHIVQIFSKDEKELYATILSIPNYRLQATDKTVITFHERRAGQPQALRAWFYPGRNWGEEFVYPKAKSIEVAESSKPPLFTQPGKPVAAQPHKRPPIMAKATGEEMPVSVVVPPAEVAYAEETPLAATAKTPPLTLGAIPVVASFGLMGLGVGIALSVIRRRFISLERRLDWASNFHRFPVLFCCVALPVSITASVLMRI